MVEVLPATDPSVVERAAEVFLDGGVVVLPTDTVYGLAAFPDDPAAVRRLFELKGREHDVPVAVLCSTAVQALSLAGTIGSSAARLAVEHWPGPLTLVLPRDPDLDWALGEPEATIGVRCPDHDLVRAVTGRLGPLAVTSANRHGEPTPATAVAAAESLAGPVDLVIDGGTLAGTASTVVAAEGTGLRVLRQGPIVVDDPSGRDDSSDSDRS